MSSFFLLDYSQENHLLKQYSNRQCFCFYEHSAFDTSKKAIKIFCTISVLYSFVVTANEDPKSTREIGKIDLFMNILVS